MAGRSDSELPAVLGRHIVVDERGVGLRATWRPAHGFVNVSLWRDDLCVETFHLTPLAAADLMAFLAEGLAASVPPPDQPVLRVVPDEGTGPGHGRARRMLSTARRRLADDLDTVVRRLRR